MRIARTATSSDPANYTLWRPAERFILAARKLHRADDWRICRSTGFCVFGCMPCNNATLKLNCRRLPPRIVLRDIVWQRLRVRFGWLLAAIIAGQNAAYGK
jgi:hypothetical protein